MLIDYIQAALRRAKYEMLADNEGFVGTIPGFRGVIGHARSLERCRDDLNGALQEWLLIKLQQGDRDIPVVDGIKLTFGKGAAKGRRKSSRKRAA
jgi:predicted RNase H-like HicB family nuclease